MRAIFEEARTVVGSDEADLLSRLEAAVTSADSDLRVSALREVNDTLRQLLGDLLASVENSTSDALRALEHRIWTELNKSTERRSVPLGPF